MFSVAAENIQQHAFHFNHQDNNDSSALWQAWARQALPGSGEFREIAVERLLDCLNNKSAKLDLSELELTSLPDFLPPHIETLLVNNNQLAELPAQFPASVETVFAANNPLTQHTIESLQAMMEAADYQGPVIHLFDEGDANNERTSLLADEEKALQAVLSRGRAIHIMVEEEKAARRALKDSFTPRTSLLAGGILAGIALISGMAVYLRRHWSSLAANHYPAGNTLVTRGNMDAVNAPSLPLAQAVMAGTTAPSLPQAQAIMADTTVPPAIPQQTRPLADRVAAEKIIAFLRSETTDIPATAATREEALGYLAGWLFPAGKREAESENVLKLAKFILRCAGDYGGKESEPLSLRMANGVVRQWAINTLLQKPLREYIAEKIAADKTGRYQTVGSLTQLISMPALYFARQLDINHIPAVGWDAFKVMWNAFIKAEIPLADTDKFAEVQNKKFTEYEFLALYAGALYLQDLQKLDTFNLQQITETGATLWGQMVSGRSGTDLLPYIITPALWFTAGSAPQRLNNLSGSYAQSVIPAVLEQWQAAQQQAHKIKGYIKAYEDALEVWTNKGALADKFIARCPLDKIMYLPNRADDYLTQQQINDKIRAGAKERYLLYDTPPCWQDNVPPSLTHEYKRVTTNVASNFKKLEKVLIEGALFSAAKAEVDFLCSATSKVYPASLKMRTATPTDVMGPVAFGGATWAADIFVQLVNTEIFAVIDNNEERIYGLKKAPGKMKATPYIASIVMCVFI